MIQKTLAVYRFMAFSSLTDTSGLSAKEDPSTVGSARRKVLTPGAAIIFLWGQQLPPLINPE